MKDLVEKNMGFVLDRPSGLDCEQQRRGAYAADVGVRVPTHSRVLALGKPHAVVPFERLELLRRFRMAQ